jgi:hypothetical protein
MRNKIRFSLSLLALTLAFSLQPSALAQDTNGAPASGTASSIGNIFKDFFHNNPTNTWDVSGYGVVSRSDHFGYGAGTRVGYWMTPVAGAALDFNYCDSSWTFTSLALAARGTIKLSTLGTASPYASLGAGWNIRGGPVSTSANSFSISGGPNATIYSSSVVGVVATGAQVHLNLIQWFDFFGEYQHLTMSPNQDRVLFGITHRF